MKKPTLATLKAFIRKNETPDNKCTAAVIKQVCNLRVNGRNAWAIFGVETTGCVVRNLNELVAGNGAGYGELSDKANSVLTVPFSN